MKLQSVGVGGWELTQVLKSELSKFNKLMTQKPNKKN